MKLCYVDESGNQDSDPLAAALSDIWNRVHQHPLFSAYVRLDLPAKRNSNGN